MNKKFFKGLGFYTGILVALALLVLGILWQFLNSYELARPERVMDRFFSSTDQEYWITQFSNALDPGLTEFESEEDYFGALYDNFFDGATFTYAPSAQYSDETPTYTVRSNGTAIATITLKEDPKGKVGFGMKMWQVESIYAIDFMSGNDETVVITVPSTSRVTLNGIELGDKYISNTNVAYDNLGDFEQMDGYDKPHRVTYTVPGLYLQPKVVVEDAQLVISDGLVFDYCHQDMGGHNVSITVPSGSTVTIGGLKVSQDRFTEGKVLPGFGELGSILSSLPRTYSLQMDGFTFAPNVEVRDFNGNLLTPDADGIYLPATSQELQDACQGMVETFAQNYIEFTTNFIGDPYASYAKLAKNLYTGSSFQSRLSQSVADMSWVYNVRNEIHDISVTDFVELSDGVGSCSLHMALTSTTNYEKREIDDTYTVTLVLKGGVWKIASMTKQ